MEPILTYLSAHWLILAGGVLLGFILGFMTGLFGAGGGFILTPVLNIFLGLPRNIAVGTSSCQVLGASTFSLYHHFDRRLLGIRVAAFMGLGIPFGSLLGVYTVRLLTGFTAMTIVGRELKTVDFILLAFFAFFLTAISVFLVLDNFYLNKNKTDDVLVFILLTGAFFGTKLGADMQKRISGKSVRKYFAVIVMAAALIVIGKLLKMILF